MNKSKMNSLVSAGKKAYRKAKKEDLDRDDLIYAVDAAIEERYGEIWPESHAADLENENLENMLDLPEFNEAILELERQGVPTSARPYADIED